ncbi:MAG: hypothetical protein ACE361_12235 [Aureliella sp.]
MMSWIRELAGWGLLVVALYLLRIAVLFVLDLDSPRIIEASVLTFASLGVLRAGTALIRISSSARIVMGDQSKKLEKPSRV